MGALDIHFIRGFQLRSPKMSPHLKRQVLPVSLFIALQTLANMQSAPF